MKNRLDKVMLEKGLVYSRSQAESYIKLGKVKVNGEIITKSGTLIDTKSDIKLNSEQYVSRAGLKLASISDQFKLYFREKTVLDVGSSTGGFTDYSLRNGAKKVIAVELGTNQLHPNLLDNPKIELHEQTDIRKFKTVDNIDIVVIDVSFISLREILPSVIKLSNKETIIVAMCKPQFEAKESSVFHSGVIKNEKIRREVLKDFESWLRPRLLIIDKSDSAVAGSKGNLERFYLLKKL